MGDQRTGGMVERDMGCHKATQREPYDAQIFRFQTFFGHHQLDGGPAICDYAIVTGLTLTLAVAPVVQGEDVQVQGVERVDLRHVVVHVPSVSMEVHDGLGLVGLLGPKPSPEELSAIFGLKSHFFDLSLWDVVVWKAVLEGLVSVGIEEKGVQAHAAHRE